MRKVLVGIALALLSFLGVLFFARPADAPSYQVVAEDFKVEVGVDADALVEDAEVLDVGDPDAEFVEIRRDMDHVVAATASASLQLMKINEDLSSFKEEIKQKRFKKLDARAEEKKWDRRPPADSRDMPLYKEWKSAKESNPSL